MSSARPRTAAFQQHEAIRRRSVGQRGPHQVARAIANHRRAGAAERGEDQVRQLAFLRRMARFDGDKLGDELGLVDVQPAAVRIGESPRPDLRRAAMIDDPCVPRRFDPLAHRRHAAARLAGHDDLLDRQLGQVDVVLGRHLGQTQRIGRRAKQRRDAGAAASARCEPGCPARRRESPARRARRAHRTRSRNR